MERTNIDFPQIVADSIVPSWMRRTRSSYIVAFMIRLSVSILRLQPGVHRSRIRAMSSEQTTRESTHLIHRRFGDFDEFCESALNWDLDYRQIERGNFTGELLIASSARVQFTRARLGRRLVQRGAAPAGMWTFGLLAASDIQIFWCGQQVTEDDLFVYGEGGELDSVTQSDFDVICLSLPKDTLANACQSLLLLDMDTLLEGKQVFRIDPEDMQQLRRFVLSTSAGIATNVIPVSGEGLSQLGDVLARLLVVALSRRRVAREPRRFRRRSQALSCVDAYLSAMPAQSPRLEDLCKVANVSERTLEYAFREYYGITPKSYINAYRLNSLRKALLLAEPTTSKVFVIAHALGFWNQSQLSADYRALFGESPSSTLQRSA